MPPCPGNVPDLSAFNVFAPTAALPPVHDVSFDAKLSGTSGAQPAVSTLNAHAGASDLGSLLPGLTLTALDVKAPAADQPVQLDASGARGGTAFTLTGQLGTLASFTSKAKPVPFPVDVTLAAAGASLAVKGDIADVAAQRGLNLGGERADPRCLGPVAVGAAFAAAPETGRLQSDGVGRGNRPAQRLAVKRHEPDQSRRRPVRRCGAGVRATAGGDVEPDVEPHRPRRAANRRQRSAEGTGRPSAVTVWAVIVCAVGTCSGCALFRAETRGGAGEA